MRKLKQHNQTKRVPVGSRKRERERLAAARTFITWEHDFPFGLMTHLWRQTDRQTGESHEHTAKHNRMRINCQSKFNSLNLNLFRLQNAHLLSEYLSISRAVSLRTATSLMPTDAIGRLQIGFTTVEAGDFPNGLRCNRQIPYIRVCHSALRQISSFPSH